jgi:hypothetical protein
MRLPNRDQAHVERGKLTDYLLNINHPDAKGKKEKVHSSTATTGATGSASGMICWTMPPAR